MLFYFSLSANPKMSFFKLTFFFSGDRSNPRPLWTHKEGKHSPETPLLGWDSSTPTVVSLELASMFCISGNIAVFSHLSFCVLFFFFFQKNVLLEAAVSMHLRSIF